jgi:aminodeoxyfutalosine synthase
VAGYEVSEFHIVGGLHPTAPFSYYLDMMAALSGRFPQAHLQAFTAVEIAHLAERGGLSVEECLAQLRAAGLGSLPGGGAEVFSPRVRDLLCPEKISGDDWRAVIRTAHQLGLRTNATMLYGHVETPAEVVDHLLALRDLQDETGGFLAFIPLAFHPAHTRMPELPGRLPYTTGCADLRMIATARLLLDNFPHIKVFWIMAGIKLAQVALSFGADDLDGTVDEERITHAAGAATPQSLTVTAIEQLIRDAGRTPVRRDTLYQRVGG